MTKLKNVHPGEVLQEEFWMGLQSDYELEEARNRLGKRLQLEVRSYAA